MKQETFKNIVDNITLPRKISFKSAQKTIDYIDDMLRDNLNSILNNDSLKKMKNELNDFLAKGKNIAKFGVFVPLGVFGLSEGIAAPDWDIPLLGIGNHRYFIFHSAIGLVVLRYFYKQWLSQLEENSMSNNIKKKVSGALLGSLAFGVGVHLAVDVFQPKSIVFPFFGSLIDGTLVDDNIWLLGNSLWAFKISHDIFALTYAKELETAKNYVKNNFMKNVGKLETELKKYF